MARIVVLQLVFAAAVAVLAALLGGIPAGISSILAGLSCVIPNAVFAFGLQASDREVIRPGSFVVWELVKILLTAVLIVLAFWLYKDLRWFAFFVSLIVVLKSYILLLYKFKI